MSRAHLPKHHFPRTVGASERVLACYLVLIPRQGALTTNASLTTIIVNFLPLWLLFLAIVRVLLSGPPVLRRKVLKPDQPKAKSQRSTSPVLNPLVMISFVGNPFFE